MYTKKLTFCLFCFLGWIIVTAPACNQTSANSEEETIVITPVTVGSIIYKSLTETIDMQAVTAFINKSTVRSTTTGTVESTSISFGINVKKDQPLYTIRTRESAAINNSLKDDSTLSFNGRIIITAPKEGVISSISHQNGDFVQEGDELAVISENNSLIFILDTPYELLKYVENTRNCKIQLPDNQIIDGYITGRLPEMDTQSQTVRFMVTPSFTGNLPANLNAIIRIVKSSNPKATILPKNAILGNETMTEFWVMKLLDDTTAIKIPIIKGFENNEEVEIISPAFLTTDRIIITGGYGLPDTARVIIK
jgi:biotin carboxyl carrier protein